MTCAVITGLIVNTCGCCYIAPNKRLNQPINGGREKIPQIILSPDQGGNNARELEMRGLAMDHNDVVRQKLAERYLLDELQGEQREAFEEHFFECSECAHDIRAGSEFVESTKVILSQPAEEASRASREPVGSGWWAWLRPQFAGPA